MRIGIDLVHLARIHCSKEMTVRLVKMALQLYSAADTDPYILIVEMDEIEHHDRVGINITRLDEGIIELTNRTVRIGVRRKDGDTIIIVVDPDGSLDTMQVSTCAIHEGELVGLDNDFEKWRQIGGDS